MSQPRWIEYDSAPHSDAALWIKVLRLSGRDFFEQMLYLVGGNMAAMLLLPLVLLTPPLLGGVWWAAKQTAYEEPLSFRAMGHYAYQTALRQWKLTWLNLLVGSVIAFNLLAYSKHTVPLPPFAPPATYDVLLGGTVALGLLWIVYSLLVAGWQTLHEASLRDSLKGAAHLMIHHPAFALLLSVVLAALLALNVLLPALLFLLTWGLLAPLSVRSVQLLAHGIPRPREIP